MRFAWLLAVALPCLVAGLSLVSCRPPDSQASEVEEGEALVPTDPVAAPLEPGPTREDVLRNFREIEAEDPWARRARRVFARVRAAAEPRATVPAALILVEEPGRPEAWALEDRTVVVNREALAICFGKDPEGEPLGTPEAAASGDARLAFLLGHELAHLVGDDFWHLAAFASLENHELLADLAHEDFDDLQRREFNADRRGLQIALIAGYRPADYVFDGPAFFEAWDLRLRELGRLPGGRDLSVEQRSETMLAELSRFEADFEGLRLGTVLYSIGRYEDAIRLLELFVNVHPITEARNNLGLAHYQAAARALAECDGSLVVRYRLPTRLSAVLVRERERLRGGGDDASPCYEKRDDYVEHFELARAALQSAVLQSETDVASRINLVALHLLAHDESADVFQVADQLAGDLGDGDGLAPGDPDALVAVGLARHRFSTMNGYGGPDFYLPFFERALEIEPDHPIALFDLGVILFGLEKEAEGRAALERFLEVEPAGDWADLARRRLELPPAGGAPVEDSPTAGPESPVPLGSPVEHGRVTAEIQRAGSLRIFAPGGTVEVVLEPATDPPISAEELDRRHGTPTDRLATSLGEIRVHHGFGFELVAGEVVSTFFFEPS